MINLINCILAERLKWKRTFAPKLVWIAPVVTLLLCFVLGAGSVFQIGAYNWWYTTLLPGALIIFCSLVMQKDARMKYRSVLAMPLDLKKIWVSKILACAGLLLASCVIFFIGVTAGGRLLGQSIPLLNSIAGSLLIFTTFLWQIPLCLYLSGKCGMFVTILLNLAGNVVCGILFADKTSWWMMPYSIPIRLMCPVLNILPNGLPVEADSLLLDSGVILPGVLISLAWFGVLSLVTTIWFQRQEAK